LVIFVINSRTSLLRRSLPVGLTLLLRAQQLGRVHGLVNLTNMAPYYWTQEQSDKMVSLREDSDLTWVKVADRLGPGVNETVAQSRYSSVKRGGRHKTWPWSKEHEDELVNYLQAKKTVAYISAAMNLPVGYIEQQITIIEDAKSKTAKTTSLHQSAESEAAEAISVPQDVEHNRTEILEAQRPVFLDTLPEE
jgi:hypothetical protein